MLISKIYLKLFRYHIWVIITFLESMEYALCRKKEIWVEQIIVKRWRHQECIEFLSFSNFDDVIKWWRHQIFKFWILQFIYLHCVELLWKNQVSIINNSKVITIYILNIFPFFRFEPILKILVSTIFLWKIVKKIFDFISSWNFYRMSGTNF